VKVKDKIYWKDILLKESLWEVSATDASYVYHPWLTNLNLQTSKTYRLEFEAKATTYGLLVKVRDWLGGEEISITKEREKYSYSRSWVSNSDYDYVLWYRWLWYTVYIKNAKVYEVNTILTESISYIPWIPVNQVSIWNLWLINIFWANNTNFYAWIETTEATTWNITPWNFVWYIKIGKYKIPYYL